MWLCGKKKQTMKNIKEITFSIILISALFATLFYSILEYSGYKMQIEFKLIAGFVIEFFIITKMIKIFKS